MSDRNSGEREIPVEILEKREFRCWSGTCLRTNFRYCSGIGLKKCFMFPSVPALVTLLILEKKKKWEQNQYRDQFNRLK